MTISKTRDRLIATAMQMFWQRGYASTSVADILQEAGVNSGSLYHFFPGKQDVLLAVLGRYREGIGPMLLEPAWRNERDPIEKVFALLARYRQAIVQTDHTYGCPIGGLALEIHEPDPPVREALAANFAAWTGAVRGCLEAAGNRLPMRLDRKELAEFILTVMEGGVMQSRTHRSVAYFDGSVRHLRRYVDQLQREAGIERGLDIKRAGPTKRPKSVARKRAK